MNIGVQIQKVGNDTKRKRYIQIAFLLFTGVLIFFTLFSNTIESIRLPKVTTEIPTMGAIEHKFEGSGVLRPITEVKLVSSGEWKVKTIHVKEGDRVKKGQTLVTYDGADAKRELRNDEAELEKQQIELQNIQDHFIQIVREDDEMVVRKAKRDVATHKLNMEILERNIQEKRELLEVKKEIVAPFDGLVSKINVVEGITSTGEPDVIMIDSRLGYEFEMVVDAALVSSLALTVNSQIEVEAPGLGDQPKRILKGAITRIAHSEPRKEDVNPESDRSTGRSTIAQKTIFVKLVEPSLKGGEQVSVMLTKQSEKTGMLVLDKAVHQDRKGKYVYKVEEQRGALGNVFIARKVDIEYMETSHVDTMIQSNELSEDDRIILESSEPIQDNSRVRLE
ncbi:biotin/lipoyl-binding protein [Paenibacillus sp. SC116]|uniref:efflux RND transporter periplasmic adaptor subunit n=1 Tax=Paenibacillus sp. SC116 TaxID=2968986 RepID=UPI00215B4B44|nr:biotin/lipoyl-binding protein [Paenibacillus sp. SC116]MCR8842670.1 biotin/lipoyl-binding protein [Paenibacillus sp. SC116]